MSSYLTVGEAQTYFQTILDSGAWDRATFDQQNKALAEATRIIDALPLKGTKAEDYYPDEPLVEDQGQVLRFPRIIDDVEQTEVPNDVLEACCDIALELLKGVDLAQEYTIMNRSSKAYANIKETRDTTLLEQHLLAGVPSLKAWRKLLKYVRLNESVILRRNS